MATSITAFYACDKNKDSELLQEVNNVTPLPGGKTSWWKPVAGVTFDWVLDDITSDANFKTDVVDVDAFTTSAETVAALHKKGKKVIAYFSAGTIESDRADAGLLPNEVIGKVYPEWPKEKWLDIRQIDKLKPWLNARFSMIINKGFDGVEPDNMDSYDNDPGFDIGIADVKKYADYLILLAHNNGLSIGQKNVKELTPEFASKFDWALTEGAFAEGWQEQMKPYITLNKPVFATEYTDQMSSAKFDSSVCPEAKQRKYSAILKKRDLDKWIYSCN